MKKRENDQIKKGLAVTAFTLLPVEIEKRATTTELLPSFVGIKIKKQSLLNE